MEKVVRGDSPRSRVAGEMDARADRIFEKRHGMLDRKERR